jgi:glyoxylase-like metal-dependent hydrolase (beta-lactamase superfamily II)
VSGVVTCISHLLLARQGAHRVLIDTGFMQGEGSSGFAGKFGIPTWISPVRMIEEAGLTAAAITDIFVTHAHFDHMGSIGEFPTARLHIQKSELLTWYEAIAQAVRLPDRDHRC